MPKFARHVSFVKRYVCAKLHRHCSKFANIFRNCGHKTPPLGEESPPLGVVTLASGRYLPKIYSIGSRVWPRANRIKWLAVVRPNLVVRSRITRTLSIRPPEHKSGPSEVSV